MDKFIEPCCAERQIGQLLREHRGHAALFQTNGDVTLTKWMQATMLLSGSVRPRTLTLWLPSTSVVGGSPSVVGGSPADIHSLLKPVCKYLRLEWIARLRLMTTQPLTAADIGRMAAMADCQIDALLPRLELASDETLTGGLLRFDGPDGTVVIQGPMPAVVTPSLMLYAGTYGGTQSHAVRAVTDATDALFRARRYDAPTVAPSEAIVAPSVVSGSPADTKKKSRTPKTKKNEKPTQ